MLDQLAEANAPLIHELSPQAARDNMLRTSRDMDPGPQMAEVSNFEVEGRGGGIPVRGYYPEAQGTLDAIVYYHGGGWVIGSIDTHDAYCRELAASTGRAVFSS